MAVKRNKILDLQLHKPIDPSLRTTICNMTFQTPAKAILSQEQLQAFQTSKTYNSIISYIEALNETVVGVKLTDDCEASPVREHLGVWRALIYKQGVESILEVLETVESIAKDTPPVENSASRFGNPAFRTFYDKVTDVRSNILCLRIVLSFNRPRRHCMPRLKDSLRRPCWKCLCISTRPGVVALA